MKRYTTQGMAPDQGKNSNVGALAVLTRTDFEHADLCGALRAALAGARLSAVASGGTPADALGLEQHDIAAAPGEVQRGREPGIAAADHTDLGTRFTVQRGKFRRRVGGGGVIRGHVTGDTHPELLPRGRLALVRRPV